MENEKFESAMWNLSGLSENAGKIDAFNEVYEATLIEVRADVEVARRAAHAARLRRIADVQFAFVANAYLRAQRGARPMQTVAGRVC